MVDLDQFPPIPSSREGDLVKTVSNIIMKKLSTLGAILSSTGTSFDIEEDSLTPRAIADNCWLEHSKYPRASFQIAIDNICRDLRRDRANRAKRPILDAVKNDGAELARFVHVIASKETELERMQYYITAFRQLIWQVKRRMRGLPSAWDLMVVMHSKQGSGKSSAAGKFGQVLGPLFMPMADFSIFSDKFRVQQLCHNYLICLDEMGRASKTDMNTIKQVITSPTVQARAIYTSSEQSLQRNASFIATTNWPLDHSIQDTSGMRRFAEIHCRDEPYTPEWGKQLNGIDFASVWACETGDEDTDAPASREENRAIMRKYQEELNTLSDFEYFVETTLEQIDDQTVKVANKDVYAHYASYCREQRRPQLSLQMFAREMKRQFTHIKVANAVNYKGIRIISEMPK